jgi:hypothetical protein
VQDIARFRPELRLLISSATMDAEKFAEYFDNAPTFYGMFDYANVLRHVELLIHMSQYPVVAIP